MRHACDKAFFVSPFLPMGLRYEFQVAPPGETIAIAIRAVGPDGPVLRAALAGQRRPLTDGASAGGAGVPFVAIKTIAAIHWQALRLIAKGARLSRAAADARPKQPAPSRHTTPIARPRRWRASPASPSTIAAST